MRIFLSVGRFETSQGDDFSRDLKVIIIRAGPFADLLQAHVVQSFILFYGENMLVLKC